MTRDGAARDVSACYFRRGSRPFADGIRGVPDSKTGCATDFPERKSYATCNVRGGGRRGEGISCTRGFSVYPVYVPVPSGVGRGRAFPAFCVTSFRKCYTNDLSADWCVKPVSSPDENTIIYGYVSPPPTPPINRPSASLSLENIRCVFRIKRYAIRKPRCSSDGRAYGESRRKPRRLLLLFIHDSNTRVGPITFPVVDKTG